MSNKQSELTKKIGAGAFALLALLAVYDVVVTIINYIRLMIEMISEKLTDLLIEFLPTYLTSIAITVVSAVLLVLLAIYFYMYHIKKKDVYERKFRLTMSVFGAFILLINLYTLIEYRSFAYVSVLAYAGVLLILYAKQLPSLKQVYAQIKWLWLIPPVFFFINLILNLINYFSFRSFLSALCTMVAYTSVVMIVWLESEYYNKNAYSAIKTALAGTEQSEESPAERIMRYKQLLDEGIITEEEFKEKKKEILGE